VGKSEENCRQIDRRARKSLAEGRRPAKADPAERDRLLGGFMKALKEGDLEGMVKLLARDATLYSDGGGKARAALKPVPGGDSVARFLLGIRRQAPPDWEVRTARVNGRPGLLNLIGGHLLSVVSFEVEEGLIREIYIVLNPDKLARVPV
jgi:RNA polymerase sigma-70 factor (ECF subfamily)